MLHHLVKRKNILVGTGNEKEAILLFKGLGRREEDLRVMAEHLNKEHGFYVAIIGHANTFETFDQSAKTCMASINQLKPDLDKFEKIHLMGVSRGGLVVRKMLELGLEKRFKNWGRVVMLGTPNQGSRFATKMTKHPIMWSLTRLTRGQSALDIRPDYIKQHLKDHFPSRILELGIIAAIEIGEQLGERRYGWLPDWLVSQDNDFEMNDGTIAMSETYLEGMKEHIVINNLDHIEMESDRDPIDQAANFFFKGTFKELEKTRQKKQLKATL